MTLFKKLSNFFVFILFIFTAASVSATTLSYTKVVDKNSRVQKKNFNYETGQLVETDTSKVIGSYILNEKISVAPRANRKKTDPKFLTMVMFFDAKYGQENVTLKGWQLFDGADRVQVISASKNKIALLEADVKVDDTTNNITLSFSGPESENSCDLTDPYQKIDVASVAKIKTMTKTDIVKVYLKFIPESELIRIDRFFIIDTLEMKYPELYRFFRRYGGFRLGNVATDFETALELGQIWVEIPVSQLPDFQYRPEVLGISIAP